MRIVRLLRKKAYDCGFLSYKCKCFNNLQKMLTYAFVHDQSLLSQNEIVEYREVILSSSVYKTD